MDSAFVEWLNTIFPGFGTMLLVFVVGGGLIVGGIKGFLKGKKYYDHRIELKKEKEEEDRKFREEIASFGKTIVDIQNEVKDLREMISNDRTEHKEELSKMTASLNENKKEIKEMSEQVSKQGKTISLMLKSEMEDIRAFITTEYFRWTEVGFIDVSAAKTLNDRYESYLAAGGDTFIADFMKVLRGLPKKQCTNPSDYFLYSKNRYKKTNQPESSNDTESQDSIEK